MSVVDSTVAQLRSDIVSGRLRPGDPLPPIGNNHSLRRVYRVLVAERLVQHVIGRGMFVADGVLPVNNSERSRP